ncbi:unnamed protein product [Symbiodinium necroappetens]|uniref:Uncharacterized protein n=1 Tax=Symbiodinium necroappetens TaxID=1628268 RepID=A0A813BXN0_9DINO|nr:unnamed protein product [Symbiodinium necroappetens]
MAPQHVIVRGKASARNLTDSRLSETERAADGQMDKLDIWTGHLRTDRGCGAVKRTQGGPVLGQRDRRPKRKQNARKCCFMAKSSKRALCILRDKRC